MRTATTTIAGARIALSTLLIAASIALTGCSVLTPLTPEQTPTETPTTSTGYVYEDTVTGYAVTFPGEPTLQTVPNAEVGSVEVATYATAPNGIFYISRGAETPMEIQRGNLVNAINTAVQAGQAVPIDDAPVETELAGLPALTADVTMPDGVEATLIVAGEGNRFYQLTVIGGTPDDRQAFFDSFELLD
jgi:hypothetical protein